MKKCRMQQRRQKRGKSKEGATDLRFKERDKRDKRGRVIQRQRRRHVTGRHVQILRRQKLLRSNLKFFKA